MGWVREVRRQRLESGVAEVTFAGLPRIDTGMAEVRTIDGGTFRLLGLDYSENRMVSRDRLGTAIARIETETSHELLELSYVSLELMWNASYVATVPEGVTDARLVASARIYNRTGRTFEDATIRLVSGISSDYSGRDEGRAEIPVPFAPLARVGSATPPRPLLELQALDLEPATVRDGYSKLVEYMSAPTVPIRIEHAIAFSSSGQERPARQDVNAGIFVDFRNDKTSGLGDYLVSGSFCIMVERADGERTLMGTGSINDTAPGELVRVYVGTAREIVATRTLLSYDGDRRTNDNERTYRLVVWNRKAHDVIVTLHDWASRGLCAAVTRLRSTPGRRRCVTWRSPPLPARRSSTPRSTVECNHQSVPASRGHTRQLFQRKYTARKRAIDCASSRRSSDSPRIW